MKKYISAILLLALSLVSLSGCGGSTASTSATTQEDSSSLQVVTSFYAMYDFAQKVGGDSVTITNLVPAGTEPHDWEPTASDIVTLETADVFIYNGAGMEHWVEDVLDSLDNQDLLLVEASQGLTLLQGHSHEEDTEDTGEDTEEETTDSHVWLDPENAKYEMNAIKEAFVSADAANAEQYESNYSEYSAKFDALDEAFSTQLAPYKDASIIVAHEAFGYLCAAYQLNQEGIEGLSPDSEPDAARMEEIITFAKEHNVTTIFFEELVSPKVAETIADELDAKTAVLNPIEGLTQEDLDAGKEYISIMEENLKALVAALSGE
ncbi:MAG: metal ABC transporter solute-binding protein, Zn/Mn family [Lachnospiraceae bacterium]